MPAVRLVTRRNVMEKYEVNRPLRRTRRRRVDKVTMYLQGTEWEGVDWTELAQDGENWPAVVTTAIDFGVHKMPYIF
jgi:hypothetical protein